MAPQALYGLMVVLAIMYCYVEILGNLLFYSRRSELLVALIAGGGFVALTVTIIPCMVLYRVVPVTTNILKEEE